MEIRRQARGKETLILVLLFVGLCAVCSARGQQAQGTLHVSPSKIILSSDLLKEPPSFSGSGFRAGEAITVELRVPQGLRLKGMAQEEPWVGIAFAKANEKGEFQCKMAPTAILNWFFQVDWTSDGKPDMSKASPLPQGSYKVRAVGMDSDVTAEAGLEIVHQAK